MQTVNCASLFNGDVSRFEKWNNLKVNLTFFVTTTNDAKLINEIFQTTNYFNFNGPSAVYTKLYIDGKFTTMKFKFVLRDAFKAKFSKPLLKMIAELPHVVKTMILWAEYTHDVYEPYQTMTEFCVECPDNTDHDLILMGDKSIYFDTLRVKYDEYANDRPTMIYYVNKYQKIVGMDMTNEPKRYHQMNVLIGINNRDLLMPTMYMLKDVNVLDEAAFHFNNNYNWFNYTREKTQLDYLPIDERNKARHDLKVAMKEVNLHLFGVKDLEKTTKFIPLKKENPTRKSPRNVEKFDYTKYYL